MLSASFCKTHCHRACGNVTKERRISRHRARGGVRGYNIEGESAWKGAESFNISAIQAYDAFWAERSMRRKRRLWVEADNSQDVQVPELPQCSYICVGTDTDALHTQPDDINPCCIEQITVSTTTRVWGIAAGHTPVCTRCSFVAACGRRVFAASICHAIGDHFFPAGQFRYL